jgi:hypothetical protein
MRLIFLCSIIFLGLYEVAFRTLPTYERHEQTLMTRNISIPVPYLKCRASPGLVIFHTTPPRSDCARAPETSKTS